MLHPSPSVEQRPDGVSLVPGCHRVMHSPQVIALPDLQSSFRRNHTYHRTCGSSENSEKILPSLSFSCFHLSGDSSEFVSATTVFFANKNDRTSLEVLKQTGPVGRVLEIPESPRLCSVHQEPYCETEATMAMFSNFHTIGQAARPNLFSYNQNRDLMV